MASMVEELKRRNVIKVAVAYAIVAWLIIQIVIAVSDPLQLPDWFDTAVIVLIGLGFPVALVLAWAFELTPDGIKPAHEVPPDESVTHVTGRKHNHIIIALFIGAALGAFSLKIMEPGATEDLALTETIPQIEAAINTEDWETAYALAMQLEASSPGNAALAELWPLFSFVATIPSEPPGARVYRRPYTYPDAEWQLLGTTPLENMRFPLGLSEVRLELDGYRPLYRTMGGSGGTSVALEPDPDTSVRVVSAYDFKLAADGAMPENKVRVPGWTEFINGTGVQFNEYLLDKYEVSNREYKAFMDAGAYQRPEFWLHPFNRNGQTLSFAQAMALFTDRSGLHGPSTWVAGDYPDGEDDYPVAGVSWYEAAAYARFKGEELPSHYHWRRALAMGTLTWTSPASNLDSDGPLPVGASGAMDWTGAYDLQGNVREWVFNENAGQRYILGGGWEDTQYIAASTDTTRSPFDRSPANGFRLAVTDDPRIDTAMAPLELSRIAIDFSAVTPISDDTFAAYQRMFAYDDRPLDTVVEAEVTNRNWTRQLISLDAGYEDERMLLYLYLPLSGTPPYQTVVYWTGAQGVFLDAYEKTNFPLDFLVRNGRVVAVPILKENYERGGRGRPALPLRDTAAFRDLNIQWVTELRRTLDYLDSRNDIDSRGYGYVGVSWGSVTAPVSLTMDDRFNAAVIVAGGALREDPMMLQGGESFPEIYPVTYLPRIDVPVLMMNGEYDMIFPLEIAARPFFDMIGSPEAIKKLVIFPGGHVVPRAEMISESLDWFDRYLGRVQ
jgi:dienelactone hydrolase